MYGWELTSEHLVEEICHDKVALDQFDSVGNHMRQPKFISHSHFLTV